MSHRNSKLHNHNIYIEVISQTHAGSLIFGSVPMPLGAMVNWFWLLQSFFTSREFPLFHQFLDEASMVTVIRNHFTGFFFFSGSVYCIHDLWVTQSLVLGPAGSVRDLSSLVAWTSIWTNHWLANPTSSESPLLQYLL